LRGVDRAFLVTAMDEHIARRETNLIRAAAASGVRQVVKLFGAVRHRGDRLVSLHEASIEALRHLPAPDRARADVDRRLHPGPPSRVRLTGPTPQGIVRTSG
jgi:hypothetical protein